MVDTVDGPKQRQEGQGGCMVVHRTVLRFLRDCVSQRRKSADCFVTPQDVVSNRDRDSPRHSVRAVSSFQMDHDRVRRNSMSSSELCERGGEGKCCYQGDMCSQELTTAAWNDNIDGIAIGKTLGRGHFGAVYQAVLRGKVLAIKIIKQDGMDGGDMPPAERMLTGVSHPNLVQIFDVRERQGYRYCEDDGTDGPRISFGSIADSVDSWCRSSASSDFLGYLARAGDRRETWVFMEYCDRGALWEAVKRGDFNSDVEGNRPCWVRIVSVAAEIASAMCHLHAAGIIHGDLKPHNVLLKTSEICAKGFVAKVGDFGLSKPYVGRTHVSVVSHGAVDHMPPEVLKDGYMSAACDVFSFGMVLWELCTGQKPFKGLQQAAIVVAIVEGHRPTVPPTVPRPLASLIQDCWQQDPQTRPKFPSILKRMEDMEFEAMRWERSMAGAAGRVQRTGISVPPRDFVKGKCTK